MWWAQFFKNILRSVLKWENLGTVCLFLTRLKNLKWGLTFQISMKEIEGTVLLISVNPAQLSMSFSKSAGPSLFSKHGLMIIITVTVEENPWGQTAVRGLLKGERIRPGLNSAWKLGHLSKNISSCFLFGNSRDRKNKQQTGICCNVIPQLMCNSHLRERLTHRWTLSVDYHDRSRGDHVNTV